MRSLVLCCALVAAGCVERGGSPPPLPQRFPNILLISIDALGAKHLGCYGNRRATSPFLDGLAASGLRFQNAFVNTHGTPPSHTTMLSGTFQETHRVGYDEAPIANPGVAIPISRAIPWLPEILRKNGYHTLAVTDGGNIGAKLGFGRGFDHFDDDGGGVVSGVKKLLGLVDAQRKPAKPLFLFYHTYEVHSPYQPPPSHASLFGTFESSIRGESEELLPYVHRAGLLPAGGLEKLRALYDAEVRFTDDVLRSLFRELERRRFFDDALVIVTSDHGEEFGEHGGLLHRDHLYDSLVHIPLIVAGNRIPAARVENSPVSLVDIAPSLLSYARLDVPSAMQGSVFLPAPRSRRDAVFMQYGGRRFAIRTRRWKLIQTTEPAAIELYDLPKDPGETTNVAREQTGVVRDLSLRLSAWRREHRPIGVHKPAAVALGPEEIRKLKALGYLAGPTGTPSPP